MNNNITTITINRMKKISLILAAILIFAGCASNQKTEKNVLTVTIEPQRFFLEQIVGDKFTVNTLVPAGSSPETYEPSPKMMIDLGNSKAYFKVGFLGYENAWAKKLSENNPNTKIVDCSSGIELVHDTHGHHHDHGVHDDHGDHDDHFATADPHIWSSTKNAIQFSKNMLDAMLGVDPENASFYQENYDRLVSKIQATDREIEKLLGNIPSRSFIVYHPALSYFARDFNLVQHSIEFEGKNPSPAQIRELVDLARRENVKTVFIQQEFDVKNSRVIAQEIGAKTHVINPLAYEWDQELIHIAKILSEQ